MRQHRRLFALASASFLLTIVGFLLPGVSIPPAAAAGGTTYTVTSTNWDGPGSLKEAIDMANANPGLDFIEFTPGLQVDARTAQPLGLGDDYYYYAANISDAVVIDGKGGAVNGEQTWVTLGGLVNPLTACPADRAAEGTKILAEMPGFINIGRYKKDNSSIEVTVRNLTVRKFNTVALVFDMASLTLEEVLLQDIWTTHRCVPIPAIQARNGASLTLRGTAFHLHANFVDTPGDFFDASIGGDNAGDLVIEESTFDLLNPNGTTLAIFWGGAAGSTVNIVSSRFSRSGAIQVVGDLQETNIVNTIWNNDDTGIPTFGATFVNSSTGDMNIVASTLIWNSDLCGRRFCGDDGLGEVAFFLRDGSGAINFRGSAVGINFPELPPSDLATILKDLTIGGFTADEYTYIQPNQVQDAATLRLITGQPVLLTGSPAFNTPYLGDPSASTLWVGALATPAVGGVLIDVIPDAGIGGNNELMHPISGLPIEEDALGNPRVDGNDYRDVGAVQLWLAPHLTAGIADGSVDLAWTKPEPPSGGPIAGYEVCHAEVSGALPDPSTLGDCTDFGETLTPVSGPDTLQATISSLTNGMAYWFAVRAVDTDTLPWSNVVTATPLGSIGTPVVTATPGDREVALSWTLPDLGGREFSAYTILWRVAGTTDYTGGQATYSPDATSTTVTGLKNGTSYEFAVAVLVFSGAKGPQGLATATPFKPTQPPGNLNCTRTQGYWSTHSEYGPSLYDATWAQLPNGADTPFFLSGQSYYQAINTDPEGNAYYILAQQYIAAELNFLHGADPADAQAAFDAATALFNAYTPTDIAGLPGDDPLRVQFIDLAYTLDQYNMGFTGPGYCTE